MNSTRSLLLPPEQLTETLQALSLAYYRAPRSGYQDTVSRSFELLKHSDEHHTRKWVELAGPIVSTELSFTHIVRALAHDETVAGGTSSLDRMCEDLARRAGASYCPERLHKTRTTAELSSLAGKQVKRDELAGVYQFNGEQLPETARILIVDDMVASGSTLEAIDQAIRTSMPKAETVAFALVKRNGTKTNSHLDAGYFFSGNDYISSEIVTPPGDVQCQPDLGHLPQPTQDDMMDPAPTAGISLKKKFGPVKRLSLPGKKGKKQSSLYIALVVVASTLLGAFVQFQASQGVEHRDEPLPDVEITAIVPDEGFTEPEPITAPKKVEFRRIGTITVPNVGLRLGHSFDAKVITRSPLRHGERVGILKRVTPGHGPAWVEVKTKSGRSGWVLASVVREATD